jgi:hypothetical protein
MMDIFYFIIYCKEYCTLLFQFFVLSLLFIKLFLLKQILQGKKFESKKYTYAYEFSFVIFLQLAV